MTKRCIACRPSSTEKLELRGGRPLGPLPALGLRDVTGQEITFGVQSELDRLGQFHLFLEQ